MTSFIVAANAGTQATKAFSALTKAATAVVLQMMIRVVVAA
ncbi:hypothetical protein [Streptomyces sp. NPDC088910]